MKKSLGDVKGVNLKGSKFATGKKLGAVKVSFCDKTTTKNKIMKKAGYKVAEAPKNRQAQRQEEGIIVRFFDRRSYRGAIFLSPYHACFSFARPPCCRLLFAALGQELGPGNLISHPTLLIALLSGFGFLVAYHTYGRWLGIKIFRALQMPSAQAIPSARVDRPN